MLAAALALSACAPASRTAAGPQPPASPDTEVAATPEPTAATPESAAAPTLAHDWVEEGQASWYGPNFVGRPTANGETFDPQRLTAAHPSLPFDTRVRVTHLATDRSVVVRINDRGPFKPGRVIDLSRAAAEAIGLISSGVAAVRIEPAEASGGPRTVRVDPRLGGYDVIVPGLDPGSLVVLRNEAGASVLVRAVPLTPQTGAEGGGEAVFASSGLASRLGDAATVMAD
ncbi:MAG: septal ring lytic transglycosylase RlpA family protein [Trueperaceae bacterium]|nr:septal ring lytic transglycosylase RlpA family protein [Trueperaceae bacterium]